jgi:chromosome segregation protein
MFFKSLSLFGFKSFADKTYLEFPKGITCIVGPNGSGKSNILDALRWIFGEQKASELRGDEMGEVIFGGTQARQGANYAEVVLTLDEVSPELLDRWGSTSELTVARRIYHTGERENFINNRKVRLKDVKDVFFDAGIGPRSISIIEQEKVTKIINAAPMELRNYLEETAGLVRYKERRKDAEIRLKQTESNLTRIGDILSVLSEDIIRLEGQVSLLEDYRRLKTEKETLEKTGISIRYRQALREKKNHTAKIEELRTYVLTLTGEHTDKVNEEIALTGELARLRGDIAAARLTVESGRKELSRLENALREKELEKENAENTKAMTEKDINNFSESLIHKKEALQNAEALQLSESAALKETEEKLSAVKKELELLRDSLSSINNIKKEENKKFIRLAEFVSDCKNRLNQKQAEQRSFEGNLRRYDREIEDFNAESADIAQALAKVGADKEKVTEEIKNLRGALGGVQTEREKLKDRLRAVEGLIAKLSADIKITAERIVFLKKEVSRKSGGEFIERFNAERYAAICDDEELKGLYSDLLVVEDELLEKAIEYAKTSEDSFQFTTKSNIGNLGGAERISEGLYRIGGIYRKVGGENLEVLKLTKRIGEADAACADLEAERAETDKEARSLKETLFITGKRAQELMDAVKKEEQKMAVAISNALHLEQRQKETLRKINTVEKEKELLLKTAETFAPETERLEKEAAAAEAEIAAHRLEIEKLEESLEAESLKAESKRLLELEYEKLSSAASARIKARAGEVETAGRDIAETEKNLERLFRRLNEISAIFGEERGKEVQNLRTDIENVRVKHLEDSETLAKLAKKEPDIEALLAGLRADTDRIARELSEADKKTEYHTIKGEGADTVLSELSALMQEEYGEDPEKTAELYNTDMEIADISMAAARIAGEMDALGELNMAAKTEYDEKLSQYTRQSGQLEDIKTAMANLNSLIAEIDSESSLMFEDTFYSVRKNLKDVFARFFGAGSADIKLTDPDDPLRSGVELSFNPPGKKISNKNLLSGGEKAIAALVLLFALFLRKPTPFCFLDEVDAPLDDENAKKFINMIKQVAEETQFAIITHKHLTMSYADCLYGVTMQEGGVSTLLSVELKD